MKIVHVIFELAKYGGIVPVTETILTEFKRRGHEVSNILLKYNENWKKQSTYEKVTNRLQITNGYPIDNVNSENVGYRFNKHLNVWSSTYRGWVLPPENEIPVYADNALEKFKQKVSDVDIIIWGFLPTKVHMAKGFDWWHKFLENDAYQIVIVHDAYYNKRNQWVSLFKNKIDLLLSMHYTGYKNVEGFEIPRFLGWIPVDVDFYYKDFDKRDVDFFSSHIWKTMKRMDDIVKAIPYINGNVVLGGSGIELYRMKAGKKNYILNQKIDPDVEPYWLGKRIWERAEKSGNLVYLGMLDYDMQLEMMRNSKYCIDISYSKQYAGMVNFHLNTFVIEAILQGSVPIIRHYNYDNPVKDDDLLNKIKSIVIPTKVTPKQIGEIFNNALNINKNDWIDMVIDNYKFIGENYNVVDFVDKIIEIYKYRNNKNKLKQIGVDFNSCDEKIKNKGLDVLFQHFGYNYEKLPNWIKINCNGEK